MAKSIQDLTIIDTRERHGFPNDYKVYKKEQMSRKEKYGRRTSKAFEKWKTNRIENRKALLFSNLEWTKNVYSVLVSGSTYGWDGYEPIKAAVFHSENYHIRYTAKDGMNIYGFEKTGLQKAVMAIANHRDTVDWMLRFEEGMFAMYVYHADGSFKRFEIHKLRGKGEKATFWTENRMEEYVPRWWWFGKIHAKDIDF